MLLVIHKPGQGVWVKGSWTSCRQDGGAGGGISVDLSSFVPNCHHVIIERSENEGMGIKGFPNCGGAWQASSAHHLFWFDLEGVFRLS